MKIFGFVLLFLLISPSCKEKYNEEFDLDTLPNHWIRLTEKDGNWVMFNSCYAGNQLITISKTKGRFEFLLHGEQEDSHLEILETTQRSDTVFIRTKLKNSDEEQVFKFYWTNIEMGLGRFITRYSNGFTSNELFVHRDKQTNFEKIDQPCRECWGDECDEI